ncbi:Pathogenic type III effector avirulence factor Avr cleavage site [Macleaya cordata]|uniref:Pathogenic type III effector avirulence factor Avr cleavage site n=1 Tax=Macleaya cordata TaxID=56857 RepID=A0A200QJ37_MACCD|nr:Pathogenic type III effector avirulence factor Avr cleavage site [Macleaya cordata]
MLLLRIVPHGKMKACNISRPIQQHLPVPRYGDEESENKVPDTGYSNNATDTETINPNDPGENPDVFSGDTPQVKVPPFLTKVKPDVQVRQEVTRPKHERRSSWDGVSYNPKRSGRQTSAYEFSHIESSGPYQAIFAGQKGSRSSSWASARGGRTPERASTVPKFGQWDEDNQSSDDESTHIYTKQREEKQRGMGKVISMLKESYPKSWKQADSSDSKPERAAVPKFGNWGGNNPSSVDDYIYISKKVKKGKQNGMGKVITKMTESFPKSKTQLDSEDFEWDEDHLFSDDEFTHIFTKSREEETQNGNRKVIDESKTERASSVPKFGNWGGNNPSSVDDYIYIRRKVKKAADKKEEVKKVKQSGWGKVITMTTESFPESKTQLDSEDFEPEWDEDNPSSDDEFTHIFTKSRKEKQSGNGKVIAVPEEYYPRIQKQAGNGHSKFDDAGSVVKFDNPQIPQPSFAENVNVWANRIYFDPEPEESPPNNPKPAGTEQSDPENGKPAEESHPEGQNPNQVKTDDSKKRNWFPWFPWRRKK